MSEAHMRKVVIRVYTDFELNCRADTYDEKIGKNGGMEFYENLDQPRLLTRTHKGRTKLNLF